MAIPFKEPSPKYRYNSDGEIAALDAHFHARNVPKSPTEN